MLSTRLVIGLDYGTTFTGISFCETSDNVALEKHIELVSDWPSLRSSVTTADKVPSEIAYTPEGTFWGSNIPAGVQRHMWTKLELDRANQLTQGGEAGRILHEQISLTGQNSAKLPVHVVADFLRKAKEHLITTLDTQYGPKLWGTLPITLVVTVPAVWSDAAKALTLQAVDIAGFNTTELPKLKRIITITEPEAAALYTMKSFSGSVQNEQLAVGDGFIVCDMGGGTVDQISYRVSGLNPTALEEATVGNGAQCGGSTIDRAFITLLARRLGMEWFIKIAGCKSEDVKRTKLDSKLENLVHTFVRETKSGFTGKEVNVFTLPYPLSGIDDEARGIIEGELMITAEDMIEMFAGPLAKIFELLLDQINQAEKNSSVQLKYIFMVGGFSKCRYMYSQIKAFVEDYGLQVIRPAHAWSAVARGATVKGLEGDGQQRIKNRKCRRHYGAAAMFPFISGKHKVSDKVWDQYIGQWYASNQMEWLVKKGQDLSTSSACHGRFSMTHRFPPYAKPELYLEFRASDMDKAPYRSKSNGVYLLAELRVNLDDVPQKLFKTKYSPTAMLYYELDFHVEIAVQSALEFRMTVNGKKYGSVTAKYT